MRRQRARDVMSIPTISDVRVDAGIRIGQSPMTMHYTLLAKTNMAIGH